MAAPLAAAAMALATAGAARADCPQHGAKKQLMQQGQSSKSQQGSSAVGQQKSRVSSGTSEISGYVTEVSPFLDNLEVFGNRQNAVVTLEVNDDTRIIHDGRDIALSSIPEGAEIRATYKLQGNELVANCINVRNLPKEGGMGGSEFGAPPEGTGGSGQQMDEQMEQEQRREEQFDEGADVGGSGTDMLYPEGENLRPEDQQ